MWTYGEESLHKILKHFNNDLRFTSDISVHQVNFLDAIFIENPYSILDRFQWEIPQRDCPNFSQNTLGYLLRFFVLVLYKILRKQVSFCFFLLIFSFYSYLFKMKLSIHSTLEKVLKDYRNTSYVDDTDVYITVPTVMPRNESQKIEVYQCRVFFKTKNFCQRSKMEYFEKMVFVNTPS